MSEARRRHLRISYDREGDLLEVTFDDKEGYFMETEHDRMMKRVDDEGRVIGFSILGLRALPEGSVDVALGD
ncbi:MAG: DUF2283 domain-containing protein [Dehalococcoidia bacterium]|nr:MAG: DUF2283 domain-containing protein [Dehalococcoidia bacterium]